MQRTAWPRRVPGQHALENLIDHGSTVRPFSAAIRPRQGRPQPPRPSAHRNRADPATGPDTTGDSWPRHRRRPFASRARSRKAGPWNTAGPKVRGEPIGTSNGRQHRAGGFRNHARLDVAHANRPGVLVETADDETARRRQSKTFGCLWIDWSQVGASPDERRQVTLVDFKAGKHLGPPPAAMDVDQTRQSRRAGFRHMPASQQKRQVVADQARPYAFGFQVSGECRCNQSSLATMNWWFTCGMPVVAENAAAPQRSCTSVSRLSARRSGQRMIGVNG